MAQKPSIPKGTRDFSPQELAKRNYIFDIIKNQFQLFGFQPIETPSFENSDTLLGKYGDEGDRLIFKILNSGDYYSKVKGEVERTFLLKSAFMASIRSLHSLVISSNFFPVVNSEEGAMLSVNYYDFKGLTEEEDVYQHLEVQSVDSLNPTIINTLIDYFSSSFKGHLVQFFIGDLDSSYLNTLIEKIDVPKLIKSEYIPYLRSLSGRITIKQIINPSIRPPGIPDFSEEIVELILDKNLNLILPRTQNLTREISEKALRYDLTVPFARYVVMHQNEIDFPFKRYQIQPVWRADRPQKGRFREFYQCDADIVGANSLLQEVELVQLYDGVFTKLGLKGTTIKINNRKVLSGIAEVIGAQHLLIDFTVALDKLDKIGEEKVKEEMLVKGISESAIAKASPLFSMSGTASEQLSQLESLLSDSEIGLTGVSELKEILETVNELGLKSANLALDVTLARGLNYYTGAIFEVAAPEGVQMGSIGGGGRYDDLTGIFGLKDVSGVGISFGLDRIYLVMEDLNLFPDTIDQSLQLLCLNFGQKESLAALKLISRLREQGIKADLYPTATKVQKQFKYADKRNVPYVLLLGEQELNDGNFILKNMTSGEQTVFSLNEDLTDLQN